jgi:hypothetical protein
MVKVFTTITPNLRQIVSSAAAALLALAALQTEAAAVVRPAAVLDGPGAGVAELGGVAMAEDGTAGVVWSRRDAGRLHVYAALSRGGGWSAPMRVDVGQAFDSRWPVIGAGNDGRLVVVWTHDAAPGVDRVYSSSLDPGSSRFLPPVVVDYDVSEAIASYPSLAMNAGGSAYLTYRRTTDPTGSVGLPPGYAEDEIRLARFNGYTWSVLGTVVERNPTIPMRFPTAENSPQVVIDQSGNGVVAWQEPDDRFVDRIWARRLFGSSVGLPLLVSPTQWAGVPLDAPADQFSLAGAGLGAAAVALRQQPGASGLAGTRIFANTIAETPVDGSGSFLGPVLADGQGPGGPPQAPGPAAVGADRAGGFMTAFGIGGTTVAVPGAATESGAAVTLAAGGVPGIPELLLSDDGRRRVTAVRSATGVLVQERPAAGGPADLEVSSGAAGPPGRLAVAGSGHGDALVAFEQGPEEARSVAVAFVDAPPGQVEANVPARWTRKRRIGISWSPAPEALGRLSFTVHVDGREVARTDGRRAQITAASNGRHELRVTAIDGAGQQTSSIGLPLLVDRKRPQIRLRRRGTRVSVSVSDGRRRRSSGVARGRTTVSWGDRKRSRAKTAGARHSYARPGRYRVVVRARDRAGNRALLRRVIRIR